MNNNRVYKFEYLQSIFIIKNFVYNNAFIKYNVSQFLFIINNYLAYFIIFVTHFVNFKHFIINKIIDKIKIEIDIIEIQTIERENNLILLF